MNTYYKTLLFSTSRLYCVYFLFIKYFNNINPPPTTEAIITIREVRAYRTKSWTAASAQVGIPSWELEAQVQADVYRVR